MKDPRVRFYAISEFMRELVGATCGREEPIRVLKEAILLGVDPWPIFLFLARDRAGIQLNRERAKKPIGRPRGSKNKKSNNVVDLDSIRETGDPLKIAA